MSKSWDLIPRTVPRVETKYRRITTQIPVPQSISILENLRKYEPDAMSGQPPVVWDRAEGVQVPATRTAYAVLKLRAQAAGTLGGASASG